VSFALVVAGLVVLCGLVVFVGHGSSFLLVLDGLLMPDVAADGADSAAPASRRDESAVLWLVPSLASVPAGFSLARPASGLSSEPPLAGEELSLGLELDGAGDEDEVPVLGLVVVGAGVVDALDGLLADCEAPYRDVGLLLQVAELGDELASPREADWVAVPSIVPPEPRPDPPGWVPLSPCEPAEKPPLAGENIAGLSSPT